MNNNLKIIIIWKLKKMESKKFKKSRSLEKEEDQERSKNLKKAKKKLSSKEEENDLQTNKRTIAIITIIKDQKTLEIIIPKVFNLSINNNSSIKRSSHLKTHPNKIQFQKMLRVKLIKKIMNKPLKKRVRRKK